MNTHEKDMQSIKNRCPSQVYILGNSGLIGPTGPTGPQGLNGITGPTGPAPNFWIGNVTTGPPGSSAVVTITRI